MCRNSTFFPAFYPFCKRSVQRICVIFHSKIKSKSCCINPHPVHFKRTIVKNTQKSQFTHSFFPISFILLKPCGIRITQRDKSLRKKKSPCKIRSLPCGSAVGKYHRGFAVHSILNFSNIPSRARSWSSAKYQIRDAGQNIMLLLQIQRTTPAPPF